MKLLLEFCLFLVLPVGVFGQGVEASKYRPSPFAKLGTPVKGQVRYVTDGTAGSPCTGSGTGAWAYANGTSWICTTQAPPAATTPGGSDTQVQFNDGGSTFGGDAGLVYNKTTDVLTNTGQIKTPSLATTGTSGAGFVEYLTQSSAPSAPASGFREYADSSGRKSWIRASDGFTRTWDATLTGNRVYTLLDADMILVGLTNTQALTNKTVNGNMFTAGTYTITGAAGKTLTFNNTLTLAGTDSTTMTFPSTSATIARTDAAQAFTGTNTFSGSLVPNGGINTTSGAATFGGGAYLGGVAGADIGFSNNGITLRASSTGYGFAAGSTPQAAKDTSMWRQGAGVVGFGTADGNLSGSWSATNGTLSGSFSLGGTITAGGTTGAQTINKSSGSVNFAAAATSLVVTNSLVTTSSVIQCTVATNDTTMKSVQCVAASGSFTIFSNAAATAETRVNFTVMAVN